MKTFNIARHVGQLPIYYNRKPTARRGYLFDTTAPLYPFGHGLSYTTFEISAPRLAQAAIGVNDSVDVSVDVANTGKRRGDEVVQLYVRDEEASVTRPLIELKRFQRVTLNPGERRTVTFSLKPDDLALWNLDMKKVVEPGSFTAADVTAFTAGWRNENKINGIRIGDLTTFAKGDLNLDGITDIKDLVIIQNLLPAAGLPAIDVAQLGIPEPASAGLLILAGAALAHAARRTRR